MPFPGYYALVTAVDACVGRLLATLDETGLTESTVVLFCSDHGDTFGHRAESVHKYVCYEEVIRVPFLVRWPRVVQPGTVIEHVVGLEDVAPSLLDWAQAEPPYPMSGRSILPLLRGEAVAWRDSYYVQTVTDGSNLSQRALRTAEWKLILSQWGRHELYHLLTDPEEELDLFETPRADYDDQFRHFPSHQPVVMELARRLDQRAAELEDTVGVMLARTVQAQLRWRERYGDAVL